MLPFSFPLSCWVRRALPALLLVSTAATLSAQQVTFDCPAVIDSTALTGTSVNDTTEHTYAVGAGEVGTFADCSVSRKFSKSISALKVFIVGGRADDIGYVGSTLVTDVKAACSDVGTVTGEIEVTNQVAISGDTASFLLRAEENCCCSTGWGSLTQDDRPNARFRWEVTLGSDRQVRAAIGASAASGATTDVSDTMKTAHFPLGSSFTIQLLKKDANGQSNPVNATFALQSQNVAPAITGRTLFPSRVAVAFDAASNGTSKTFQSLHLGNAVVRITPVDTTQTAVSLPIVIETPANLGATHTEFDVPLSAVAHDAGVPPQVLKSQVHQESDFIATAYRYEPLSIDLDLMSVNGRNLRTTDPYFNFRLATSDSLAQGAEIITEDISPRERYSIIRNGARRRIAATDTLVTAREIYDNNDRAIGWSGSSSQARLRRIAATPSLMDFTAQTPLAASYGWFQVLYTTAIASQWTGIDTHRNPSYLFDTVTNLNRGGGSIRVGMTRLRGGYLQENSGLSANPQFANLAAFNSAWQRALNNYNHNTPGEATHPYGIAIVNRSQTYQPTPSGAIFR